MSTKKDSVAKSEAAPVKQGKVAKPSIEDNLEFLFNDEMLGSDLSIPPDVKARFEAEGAEGRWIDLVNLKNNGGYHKRGWRPYQRKRGDTVSAVDYRLGVDPDGYIRRGNLVLSFRSKELGDKHRASLNERARRQSASIHTKKTAQDLRAEIKDAGIKEKDFRIDEGYSDD